MGGDHQILQVIVRDFDALTALLDRTIERLSADNGGGLDIPALHRAKEAAQKGAELARNAMPKK